MIYGAVSPNDCRYTGEPCNEKNYKRYLDLHDRNGLQAHGFHSGSPAKAFTAPGCNFACPNRLENMEQRPRWFHTGDVVRKGVGAATRPFPCLMLFVESFDGKFRFSDVFFLKKSYFRMF
jgi:hypothetical protein